jgi:peptidoglycan/xylan/chitin deacetylase (PgdA/CDA1 family)/type IV secretory pathway TrbF-like protein
VRARPRPRRIVALLLAVPLGLAAVVAVSTPAAAAPATIVTLTYDDGAADAYQAGEMMSSRGMRGTFFVNSGPIGSSGYMTRGQLDALAAAGHEIGGHTVTHANLATLSTDEAQRQICNDRSTLLSWGFAATSFAYPYSSIGTSSRGLAQQCGYNSARQVGDIVNPGGCNGCDYAETIPPKDAYYTRAPDSIEPTWSQADIRGLVTQAQQNGGGWVQVVFHHVCDSCDAYAVTPANLTSFLDWLKGQVDGGTVVVKTVDEVMGGSLKPAVAGPPPPAPAPAGVNGLTNPGLESSADGTLPTCWQQSGFGTNTATFARVGDAHTGSWAERITMTSRTSGDRKLLSTTDLGQCSASVTAGNPYTLSAWYKSDVPTTIVAYYRNAAGGWSYWGGSPPIPAAAGWTKATWAAGKAPADATAVSFGLALAAAGTLTTDDYALVDTTPAPGDTTAPVATLTSPADGATVTGTVAVTATATDNVGVARVDVAVDGTKVGSATSSPYQVTWASDTVANGSHTVTARAYDAAGNASAASGVTVTTSNTAVNPVANASLETAAATVPDCFQVSATGTNTGTAARTSTARTGSWAEQVSISSRTSGDRKLITKQDAGTCAPAVTAGRTYKLSTWYTSDVAVPFVVYYRNAGGSWVYWQTSPTQPASSTWRRATWTTPALPTGATHVSFGLALTAVGTLITDDYALADGASVPPPPPADTTAPVATLTSPADGATVTGTVAVTATATDNVGVARVDVAVDGTKVGSATSSPYQVTWASDTVANGSHTVSATAYDAAGNASAPATATVTTNNTAVNPVTNAGLETAATTVPDCFQVSTTGTSTGTAARTSTARSGSWAEQITVTARTSGDRKLITKQDAGTCAPAVVAGRSYQVSAWYTSGVPVPFVVYYRNAAGSWVYWQTSPSQPASSTWRQATWTTPALPAGATHVSFGLALTAVGTLTTDDYGLSG